MKKLRYNKLRDANFLSVLTYWWMNDFFKHGSKNNLVESDMLELLESDLSEKQCSKLESAWNNELANKQQPSFIRAILSAYKSGIIIGGFCVILEELLRIGIALIIGYLVRYFDNIDQVPSWHAYILTAALVVGSILIALLHHLVFYRNFRLGWLLRVSICGLIYKKTLRLSQYSMRLATAGRIVNLTANDVLRYDQLVGFLHYFYVGPLLCIIATVILWQQFNVAILAGMGVLCISMTFQALCGRLYSTLRLKVAALTDERVRLMSEVIAGIRIIKMYTWEKPFSTLLTETRRKEVGKILQSSYVKACNMTLFITQDKLVTFVTLMVHVSNGGSMTAFNVFLLIAIMGALRIPTGSGFLRSMERISESISSTKRIKEFLLLEEIAKDESVSLSCGDSTSTGCFVEMKNFTAKWDSLDAESHKFRDTLDNLTFRVNPGELLVVVGPVGGGKSSLLNAILGELPPTSGKKVVEGTLTYASQTPWVFSGTIRDNILFGEQFNESRYKQVISSCCLLKDLKQLPEGDHTLVGERGVTLSGGQKARLNLARAVYKSDASIYLLDDPLSAVDPPVARHIYNDCISSLLKNKTRILVTHQLQLLETADKILILKDGRVVGYGTYKELKEQKTDFATLMKLDEEKQEILGKVHSGVSNQAGLARSLGDHRSRASQRSTISAISFGEDVVQENIIPIELEENLETGSVDLRTYLKYFRAGGGWILLTCLVLLFSISNALLILPDWWLTQWSAAYRFSDRRNASLQINSSVAPASTTIAEARSINNIYYMSVHAAFCASLLVAMVVRLNLNMHVCVSSGINLHKSMLKAILRAPVRFFDTNPVGRILNRFSKDMGQVDELLPLAYQDFFVNCGQILAIVIMVASINYLAIVIIIPSVLYFLWLRRYYIRTSRDIKRLEGACRSPVFSLLSSTIEGLITVRGFKVESKFQRRFYEAQDLHSASWFLFLTGSRWFGVRLDLMTAIFLGTVALICVVAASVLGMDAGKVGLILTQSATCNAIFQWGVRQSAEVESYMTSVERIQQYNSLKPEAPNNELQGRKSDASWPTVGSIDFRNVCFAYYDEGPTVLKNVDLEIHAKEKIGLVGRTGAGKSSIISAMFRLAELRSGKIYIDGLDISSIGLDDLRSVISIIPQDPVLFSGSLRQNLDLCQEFSDENIWDALNQVQLENFVTSLPNRLDSKVSETGSNFSVGQRQLVCLARALLRKNKILLVDEATANVDLKTDSMIQKTIRERFTECTVITIAHRINTIIDSDRIIVLDAGVVKEFDSPCQLLQRENGLFSAMVNAMGPTESTEIREMANMARITGGPTGTYDKNDRSFSY